MNNMQDKEIEEFNENFWPEGGITFEESIQRAYKLGQSHMKQKTVDLIKGLSHESTRNSKNGYTKAVGQILSALKEL